MRGLVSGSFDPITLGHMDVIMRAYRDCGELTVCIFHNETKKPRFSIEDRLRMIAAALQNYPEIVIDSCNGYVADYCKQRNIARIYRGFRNAEDYAYETLMAKYNLEHCGAVTVLYPAQKERENLSSSLVKAKMDDGQDPGSDLPDEVAAFIEKQRES